MIYKTSLFDIPIYKTTLLNQDKIKEKFIKEVMEKLTEIPPNNNNLNLYSDYFEGLDKLGPEWVELYTPTVQNFLNKAGFNKNKKWKVDVDLWYNVGVQGSFQEEHDHQGGYPSTIYSAIHYLIFDPVEHESTVFYNPMHHMFLRNMHPCKGYEMPDDWNQPWHLPKVKEGDMVFFPSYVRHSVPHQKSTKARATIALNLTIGDPGQDLFKDS